MIAAGAAGVHWEDQLASEKKCGHLGGKVLIPVKQHIRTLTAARLAADVAGIPTVVVARTDALAATLPDLDARCVLLTGSGSVFSAGYDIGDLAPERLADRVRHAGAIFLGRYAPEAIGDYVAGSNHVLPTARSARFSSGLGVLDFMKRTSILRLDADALGKLGPAAIALGEAEGLGAHARSVAMRLNRR